MDADLKKIKKLTLFMKKEGLLSVKLPDLELNLAPAAVFHVEPKESNKDNSESKDDLSPQYTEEELLFWSSPGIFPESKGQF